MRTGAAGETGEERSSKLISCIVREITVTPDHRNPTRIDGLLSVSEQGPCHLDSPWTVMHF